MTGVCTARRHIKSNNVAVAWDADVMNEMLTIFVKKKK